MNAKKTIVPSVNLELENEEIEVEEDEKHTLINKNESSFTSGKSS